MKPYKAQGTKAIHKNFHRGGFLVPRTVAKAFEILSKRLEITPLQLFTVSKRHERVHEVHGIPRITSGRTLNRP